MGYKKCFVPSCNNTSKNAPNKIFISVPKNEVVRKKWHAAVQVRDIIYYSCYCCEDHFNLEEDVSNWMFYKTIGSHIKMKPNVVPHKHLTPSERPDFNASQLARSDAKRKSEFIQQLSKAKIIRFDETTKKTKVETVTTSHRNTEIILSPSNAFNLYKESIPCTVETDTDSKTYIKKEYPIYKGPLYICSYCHIMFISEDFLCRHQKKCIHIALISLLKSKFQLNKNLTNKAGDQQIMNTTQNKASENYFCNECFSVFFKFTVYLRHMRERHPGKTYECYKRNQKHFYKIKLQRHISKTHQKENPQCSKSSIQKSEIGITHSSKKPFECNECEKSFSTKGLLNQHKVTHSSEKQFCCEYCKKSFSRRSSLCRHLHTHSGEKHFGCTLCPAKFRSKAKLNSHLLNALRQPYHTCN